MKKCIIPLALSMLLLSSCKVATGESSNSASISTNTSISASTSEITSSSTQISESSSEIEENRTLKDVLTGDYVKDESFKNYVLKCDNYNSETTAASAIYASATASDGDGSLNNPYSLQDAIDASKPGDTVFLRGGTYNLDEEIYLSKSGTKDKYITIKNYGKENPIITSNKTSGEVVLFSVEGSYIKIEGISFQNVKADNVIGIAFWDGGQSNVVISNCMFEKLETTKSENAEYGANAILLMGESKTKSINNIYIARNIVYNCTLGYSEAISISGNCEAVYVDNNSLESITNIGIDFYGNAKYCKDPALDQPRYCIAFGNVIQKASSSYADCAGIYVDGARNILVSDNWVNKCQYGIEIGSEERNDNYPVNNIIVANNKITNNTVCGIRIGGFEKASTGTVKNVSVKNNILEDNKNEFIINKTSNVSVVDNTITPNDCLLDTEDFDSSYITNFEFKNNIIKNTANITVNYLNQSYTVDDFVKLWS